MRVGTGTTGTVIDIQIFRVTASKDTRAKQIEEERSMNRKDLNEEYRIVSEATFGHLAKQFEGQKVAGAPGLKKSVLAADFLQSL